MAIMRDCLSLHTLAVIFSLIQPCRAALPDISIYGMVAGAALVLVLTALLITVLISRCRCRMKHDDVESNKTNKDVEKGMSKKSKKSILPVKAANKPKQDVEKGKPKKDAKKEDGKKGKEDKKDKKNKAEKEKKAQKDNKKDNKKDKKKGKKDDKIKDTKEGNKTSDKWKNAVSKINSHRTDVSPIQAPTKSKQAWTTTIEATTKKAPVNKRWN